MAAAGKIAGTSGTWARGSDVEIRYLNPAVASTDGSRAVFTSEKRSEVTRPYIVKMKNGRELKNDAAQLRDFGFTLVPFKSALVDCLDQIQNPSYYRVAGTKESPESVEVRDVYFKECEDLLQRLTGADVVHEISHAVRSGAGTKEAQGVEYLTAYATFAHCDYTEEILPKAWKMVTKRGVQEAEAKSMTFAFLNIWQPTRVQVETAPLALMSWSSARAEEVNSVVLGYDVTPKKDKEGNIIPSSPPIALPVHSVTHDWYFYPLMQVDEALVFTQVDGRPGFAQHSFHTAIKHQMKDDPVPRQSVEARFVCGFSPGNPNAAYCASKM